MPPAAFWTRVNVGRVSRPVNRTVGRVPGHFPAFRASQPPLELEQRFKRPVMTGSALTLIADAPRLAAGKDITTRRNIELADARATDRAMHPPALAAQPRHRVAQPDALHVILGISSAGPGCEPQHQLAPLWIGHVAGIADIAMRLAIAAPPQLP